MLKKGNRANTLHGILLIVLFSFAAFYIAGFPLVKKLSFSPLIVGIVLGMLYANSLRNKLPETWVPGIRFCTKQVLRWGIILYGFRLTLSEVAAVGIPAVAVDLVVVTVTILGGVLLGRLLKIDRDTALMTSTGSAICGAAAVLGAEPVVKCEGYKTAIAVSTVVIFGTLSMFLYPLMYRTGMLDGLTDTGVAVYTGSTLHEVAHVAGAGNAMDPTDTLGIAGTATITKMIRVMMLAPVLVILGFVLARRRKTAGGAQGEEQNHHSVVRIRVYRGHLPQFAAAIPDRGGECPRHSVERRHRICRYVHADDGHDGAGYGNEHRQVQTCRGEALRAGGTAVCLAGRGRLFRHQIPGRDPVTGFSAGRLPEGSRFCTRMHLMPIWRLSACIVCIAGDAGKEIPPLNGLCRSEPLSCWKRSAFYAKFGRVGASCSE